MYHDLGPPVIASRFKK